MNPDLRLQTWKFDNMVTALLEGHSQMGCKFLSLPSTLPRLPHCLPIHFMDHIIHISMWPW